MLNKKRVLVTGITGGLGFTLVKLLLLNTFDVLGIHRGSKLELVHQLSKIAKRKNTHFRDINLDLENPNILKKKLLSKSIEEAVSTISHIVICHGKNFSHKLHELEWNKIEESMRVNFGSAFILAQYFINIWINEVKNKHSRKDRSIVYISTVATKGGSPQEIAYHSAKRAMESAMLSFAREGAQYGIRANIVSPGLMDTEMGKQTAKDRPDIIERIPLKRLTGVEEVAKAVLFLIQSPSITGQNIHINGGRHPTI